MLFIQVPGTLMSQLQQGFILTRHWRETPAGTEVSFWLATDNGPRRVCVPYRHSVAFFAQERRAFVESVLRQEPDVELRPLDLHDFHHRSVWAKMRVTSSQSLRLYRASAGLSSANMRSISAMRW